jgi:hypothetical protein
MFFIVLDMTTAHGFLCENGNLAAVMRTKGHGGVKTAKHYQHPELFVVRAALDYGTVSETAEMRA